MSAHRVKRHLFSVTIDDCIVETFTVSGAGGGGKDTSNTGVRIKHPPSGAVGRAVETRSQRKNKELAFNRLAYSKVFQNWLRIESARRLNKPSVEEIVDRSMAPKNLKIELQNSEGNFIEIV